MVIIEKRDSNTVIEIIEQWIEKDTAIISDRWKAYDDISTTTFTD